MTHRPPTQWMLLLCWLGMAVSALAARPPEAPERYRQEIALYCPHDMMTVEPVRHAVLEAKQLLERGFRMPVQTFQLLKDSVKEAKVALILKQRHPYNNSDRSFRVTPTTDSWGGQYQYTISSPSKMGVVAGLFALLQQHLGFGFIHPEETITPDHFAWPLPHDFEFSGQPRFAYHGLSPRLDVPTVLANEIVNRRRDVVPMAYRHYVQWLIHNGQNQILLNAPHKTERWLKGNGRQLLKSAKDHGLFIVMQLPDDEVSIALLHQLSNSGVNEVILGEDWAGIFAFKADKLPRGLRFRYQTPWGNDDIEFENREVLQFDLGHVNNTHTAKKQQNWLRRHIENRHAFGATLWVSDWPAQMIGLLDLVEYHRTQAWMQYLNQHAVQSLTFRHAGLEAAEWLPMWLLMTQTWAYDTPDGHPNATVPDDLPPAFAMLDTVMPALQSDSLLAIAFGAMQKPAAQWLLLQPMAETDLGQSAAYQTGQRAHMMRKISRADEAELERIAKTTIAPLRLSARELQVAADRIDLGVTLMKAKGLQHTKSRDYRRKKRILDELSFSLRLTGLRAMHVAFLIEAQLKHREAHHAQDEAVIANLELAAQNRVDQAEFVRQEALQVVDRLVANFRYARGQQTAKGHTHTGHKYSYYFPLLYLTTWEQEEELVRKSF